MHISVPPSLVSGFVLGTFRSVHPIAFALAFTTQWFALGTGFWGEKAVSSLRRSIHNLYSCPIAFALSIYLQASTLIP